MVKLTFQNSTIDMAQEVVIRIVVEGAAVQTAPPASAPAKPTDEFAEVKSKELTPSQKLRLTLRGIYRTSRGNEEMTEEWYTDQIERIIRAIKEGQPVGRNTKRQ